LLKTGSLRLRRVLFDSRDANIAFYSAILEQFGQPALKPWGTDFVHSHTVFESLEYLFQGYPDLDAVRQFTRSLDYHPYIPMMVEEAPLTGVSAIPAPRFCQRPGHQPQHHHGAVLKYHRLDDQFDLVSRPRMWPTLNRTRSLSGASWIIFAGTRASHFYR